MAAIAAVMAGALACRATSEDGPSVEVDAHTLASSVTPAAVVSASAPASAVPAGAPSAGERRRTTCEAPSLEAKRSKDARTSDELTPCRFETTGAESSSRFCGEGDVRMRFDLGRLDEAVLAFDEPTRERVIELFRRGRETGRNPRAFGLVGDSITASSLFMGPFAVGAPQGYSLSPEVVRALTLKLPGGAQGTVVDYYRAPLGTNEAPSWQDPFRAARAAKIGARARWAIENEDIAGLSPVGLMISRVSPAVAVVMFGSNDAAYGVLPPEQMAATFEADLGRLVDAIERRGVVPILSTIPRHGRQPGLPGCRVRATDVSNWRVAVQTNAVSAAAARVACARHLPLVDLRHALDAVPNHGLSRDGVHPSSFRRGAGILDEDGLQCGFNVRNYVTLRMLKQVLEAAP